MSNATSLSELFNRLRSDADLSLYELERRTGIRRSTLMRIADGTTTQPSASTLNRLARALEVDPETLYDAVWKDADGPLPSAAMYFRDKYALNDEQIAKLTRTLKRFTDNDDT